MAKLLPNAIGVLVTVVLLLTVTCARLEILPFELDDEANNDKCLLAIIENIVPRNLSLTLVNITNSQLMEHLHLLGYKMLTRSFLATKINKPNEAYIVKCEYYAECEKGIDDLIKDGYWNPVAAIIIAINHLHSGQENLFKKLHRLYVFKLVLVIYGHIYVYDFDVSDHCNFTPNAITKYDCQNLTTSYSNRTSIRKYIKKSLRERSKVPYSACNMSVMVTVFEPFIFPPLADNPEPTGYEEEFIKILKRINFTNIRFTYNMNGSGTGTVHDNFTVTGALREIQIGHTDYIMGGALLSHYRIGIFDFTYPHFCDDFKLIVPKARQVDTWEEMYTVFEPLVWGLIFVALLCGILIAFILKIHGRRNFKGFVLTTLYIFGYLTNNAFKQRPGLFILTWALFAWLITCFYQSDLASIFTKPAYYREVDSFDEILERNFKLYLSKAKYNYMRGSKDLDMRGVLNSSTICHSDLKSLQAVAAGEKRYTLSSRLGFRYFEPEFYRSDGEAMLHDVIQPYFYVFRTGYLRKGNPNLKRIRFLERHLIAFSFHRRSLLAYIHKNKLKYHKIQKRLSRPLSCSSIAGLYYMFFCGWALSFITFLVEIFVSKYSK